jgi:hypothetical protein
VDKHKDEKHPGHVRERRSSLRLSDLHRIVENAVPEPDNGESKHPARHGSHAHVTHGHAGHDKKK